MSGQSQTLDIKQSRTVIPERRGEKKSYNYHGLLLRVFRSQHRRENPSRANWTWSSLSWRVTVGSMRKQYQLELAEKSPRVERAAERKLQRSAQVFSPVCNCMHPCEETICSQRKNHLKELEATISSIYTGPIIVPVPTIQSGEKRSVVDGTSNRVLRSILPL